MSIVLRLPSLLKQSNTLLCLLHGNLSQTFTAKPSGKVISLSFFSLMYQTKQQIQLGKKVHKLETSHHRIMHSEILNTLQIYLSLGKSDLQTGKDLAVHRLRNSRISFCMQIQYFFFFLFFIVSILVSTPVVKTVKFEGVGGIIGNITICYHNY